MRAGIAELLMFVFAAKLPLKSIIDTFDGRLKNVGGDADGSPSLSTV